MIEYLRDAIDKYRLPCAGSLLCVTCAVGCGSGETPRPAQPTQPAPPATANVIDARASDASAPRRIIAKALPAPPGWIAWQPPKTPPFARATTFFVVSRQAARACVPYRYDGTHVISREIVSPMLFGAAEGDDAYTPPFTLVSKYRFKKNMPLVPFVFELEAEDWDYVDAKGRPYTKIGKGIALCGYPRYTVVRESENAIETIAAEPPFAAYDPTAVERWFKDAASCEASLKELPALHSCH